MTYSGKKKSLDVTGSLCREVTKEHEKKSGFGPDCIESSAGWCPQDIK